MRVTAGVAAVIIGASLAQADDKLMTAATCREYTRLIQLPSVEIKQAARQQIEESQIGLQYSTDLRIPEYQECRIIDNKRGQYTLQCKRLLSSSEEAFVYVEAAQKCLQDQFAARELRQVWFDNDYRLKGFVGNILLDDPRTTLKTPIGKVVRVFVEKDYAWTANVTMRIYYSDKR